METDDERVPDPADCEGWRRIIQENRLRSMPMEAVVTTLQTIGPRGDQRVVGPLMDRIADKITSILNFTVDRRKRNRGDIISKIQFALLEAVLQPNSKDGRGLRIAFRTRVQFRALDAIRTAKGRQEHETSYDQYDSLPKEPAPRILHWPEGEQLEYVEQLIRAIPDERKRMAFRLHMDGVPAKSKRAHSISKALGVSDKTAEKWIAEVQDQMKRTLGETS
ncbi:MAG: hypothetical protein CVT83_05310 [Alphaproteobacteria bacterium HGW-Alphaproteobacteria-5]|nr:MAG: hypothetical protein CVT83_05310 [Alphaproteobacteria bacterium HGW-Alphaproteobacteria-5]